MKILWEVEMFKAGKWVKERRYYEAIKDKTNFDLHDVNGLRKNATFIGFQPQAINSKNNKK